MKKSIILLLVVSTFLSCSQKSNSNDNKDESDKHNINKVFALEDYQEDFNQMVDILLKIHPQPYAFISEDSLKSLIDQQYDKITDSTTVWEFLWISKKVAAAIKCGHTGIWSNNFGDIPTSIAFPVNVKYIGSKLYIIDAKVNSGKVSKGEEILTINGIDVEKLQKEIFQHQFTDGFNETNNRELINLNFFWIAPMYFGFPEKYTISIERNGNIENINLEKVDSYEETKTFLDECENHLCFDMNQESSTAIITIRSFDYYKKRLPIFKSFVDDCFQKINENNIQHLIIDLRNNGGGDPFCGSYLLRYIADKPYTYFHKDVPRYRKLKKTIQLKPNRYKKMPYILINGACFSTTGHFCSLVKENNWGIFVGDETGGTYTCNDFGKVYTLKNTKLLVRSARRIVKTTASTLTNERGIIPDHYVIPDIDNTLNNSDTILNYTLKLLEKE